MEKEVYKGQILRVTEEMISNTVWERAYLPDGVIVFPITSEGKIILIEERRLHETPILRIKPVSGILETEKGTPKENALREMQEEIGLTAKELLLFMTLKGSGTINHTQYFYMAKGLSPLKLPNPDGEDSIVRLIEFGTEELLKKLMNDEIKWSISTLGIFRLLELLKRSGPSY